MTEHRDPVIAAARRAERDLAGRRAWLPTEALLTVAAREALAPIRKLHRRNRPDDGACQGYTGLRYGYLDDWCVECSEQSGREYGTPWPCDTALLIFTSEELSDD